MCTRPGTHIRAFHMYKHTELLAMHAYVRTFREFFFFLQCSNWVCMGACTLLCVCSLPVFYAWFYVYMCTIRSSFYGRKYYIAKYLVGSAVAHIGIYIDMCVANVPKMYWNAHWPCVSIWNRRIHNQELIIPTMKFRAFANMNITYALPRQDYAVLTWCCKKSCKITYSIGFLDDLHGYSGDITNIYSN